MLEDVLREWNAVEVSAMDVYTAIFHLGEGYIQRSGEYGNLKANPLGYFKNRDETKGHYRVMLDDTFGDSLKEMQEADFSILNGLTYFGKRNTQEMANQMYAMIFDLDGITDKSLNAFLSGAIVAEAYPIPNYVVLSGHGVHLYFLFDEPVSLYPNIKLQLKDLKYALTEKMWNAYTSTEESVQYQGINQGFRVIGGKTKLDGVKVRAFQLNEHPFALSQLCDYVDEKYRVDETKVFKESKLSIEDARKKYPEWYERVIVGGEKTNGRWTNKPDLYNWWLRQIKIGASYHHRYFAIMCLAVYGVKCGIPKKQVLQDAKALLPFMNALAPDDPFTVEDIKSAMECYDERYVRFPREDIAKLSGISITANKRNNRKQSVHLKIARNTLDILNEDAGHALQGRKSAEPIVREWRFKNKKGSVAECVADTGLSKSTVYKYWKK